MKNTWKRLRIYNIKVMGVPKGTRKATEKKYSEKQPK